MYINNDYTYNVEKPNVIKDTVKAGTVSFFYAVALIVACPFICAMKGCEICIDYASDFRDKKVHEKKMKEDWYYRFTQSAPKIYNLKVW